jgi:hypothetical protein
VNEQSVVDRQKGRLNGGVVLEYGLHYYICHLQGRSLVPTSFRRFEVAAGVVGLLGGEGRQGASVARG